MTQKVIILDVAKIDIIVKQFGIAGLDAVVRRGDLFMLSADAKAEFQNTAWYKKLENKEHFDSWLKRQDKAGRIVEPDRLTRADKKKYDPNKKRVATNSGT